MVDQTDTKQLAGDFQIYNGTAPDVEGPRALTYVATLQAGVPYNIDLTLSTARAVITQIQTLWVDNHLGVNDVTIFIPGSRQCLRIAAGDAKYVSCLASLPQFLVTRADAGDLPIIFINVPIPTSGGFLDMGPANGLLTSIRNEIGALTVAKETDPNAASASSNALLRGILNQLQAAGMAVTIADGADVAIGATTQAAITNPATNGTIIQYIRGLLTQGATSLSAWVALLAGLPVTLGQKVMAASFAVTIASDQSAVSAKAAAAAMADGWDATQGVTTDAAIINPATNATLIAYTRGILTQLAALLLRLPATIGQKAMAASLAVTIASDQSSVNVALVKPTSWSASANPGATLVATCTRAAAGVGVRNVCTDISAGMVGGVGGANAAGGWASVFLRDGAAGVGAILWQTALGCPVSGGCGNVEAHGMNLAGSTNTAMTLETNTATATQTTSVVSLQGYSV